MPGPPRDPRRILARLVGKLEVRSSFVTLADIEQAAMRRPTVSLPTEQIASAVASALAEQLLLTDRRTFFDRETRSFIDRDVFRVNRRHPLVRGRLL